MTVRLFDAGHAEYLPEQGDIHVPDFDHTDDEAARALAAWADALGAPSDDIASILVEWRETGWRSTTIAVRQEELAAALAGQLEAIDIEPGGDDDTYDYWPSGVRLALDLAGRNPEPLMRIAEIVARVCDAKSIDPEDLSLGGLA